MDLQDIGPTLTTRRALFMNLSDWRSKRCPSSWGAIRECALADPAFDKVDKAKRRNGNTALLLWMSLKSTCPSWRSCGNGVGWDLVKFDLSKLEKWKGTKKTCWSQLLKAYLDAMNKRSGFAAQKYLARSTQLARRSKCHSVCTGYPWQLFQSNDLKFSLRLASLTVPWDLA